MPIHHRVHTTDSHHAPRHYHGLPFEARKTVVHPSVCAFQQSLLLDRATGHVRITAPAYDLRVPMLVVRHGQTNGNINAQFQGQVDKTDNALNAVGREQVRHGAHRLHERLSSLFGERLPEMFADGTFVLLHSPLSRAQDTAQAFINHVAEETGVQLSAAEEPRLMEMDFGILDGYTLDDVAHDRALYTQALQYRAENAAIDWKGTGESYRDVVVRVHGLLETLNAEYGGQRRILIGFAHGITINALRTLFHDPACVDADGVVRFRRNILDNADACWLGSSQHLAERLFTA